MATTTSTTYAASAAKIAAALDILEAQVKSGAIKTITATDGAYNPLFVSAARMVSDVDALKALTGTCSLRVSGTPTAAEAAAIPAAVVSKIAGTISIFDTSAHVQASMSGLLALATANKLGTIAFSDTKPTFSLNCAQMMTNASVFSHMTSLPTITVSDTAANIARNFDTLQALADGGLVTSIAFSDSASTLTLTAAKATGDGDAIAAISTSVSITVSDTAANVAAKVDALEKMAAAQSSHLTAITLTDKTPVLTLAARQLVGHIDALKLITNATITLNVVDGLTLGQIKTLPATFLPDIKTVNVSDTAANIAGDLNQGTSKSTLVGLKSLGIVKLSTSGGAPTAVTIDADKMAGVAKVLAKITGTYTLSATQGTAASAADAATIAAAKLKLTGTLSISDTAANVQANLDKLLPLATGKTLGTISFTDTPAQTISLTVAKLTADAAVVAKFTPGEAEVSVSGTAANVSKAFDTLQSLAKDGIVTAITLSDTNPVLALTVAQATELPYAIGAIQNSSFGIAISDTAVNVVKAIDMLEAMGTALTSITLTDKAPALTLTAQQIVDDVDALKLISNSSITLNIPDALALSRIQALPSNLLTSIRSVCLSDTDIAADLAQGAAKSALAALKNLTSITLTSSGTTPTVTLAGDKIGEVAQVLAKVTSNYVLAATSGTALSVADIKALPAAVIAKATSGLPVSDTAASISASIDALQTIASAKYLSSLAVSDGAKSALAITATQLASDSAVLARLTGTWSVAPTGTATAAQATALSSAVVANIKPGTLAVQDAGAKITAALDKLETMAKAGALSGITVSGTDTKVTATASQLRSDADALKLIGGSGATLAVTGTPVGDTVDLSAYAIISDVTLGLNAAKFLTDLTATAIGLSGTVDSVALTAAAKSTVHVTLNGGVTEIFNFDLTNGKLDLTLGSMVQSDLKAISVKMADGTTDAVEIASARDSMHGVLLVGYNGDTTTLVSHMTVSGGHAVFG